MSLFSSATATAGDLANAHNVAPVAVTSGALATMPIWLHYLRQASEIAADLAPLVGVLIGLVTLFRAIRGSKPSEAKRKKRKFFAGLKDLANEFIRKGGIVAVVALAIIAVIGLMAHMARPRAADAMPLGIISAPATATKPRKKSNDDAGDEGEDELMQVDGAPPWFTSLAALKGTHEGTARKPNPVVSDLFQKAGFERFKDQSAIAWCSIGLCGIFEGLGIPSAKTTMARGWLKWGMPLDKPRVGCVIVLARGNDGVSGHVGLYAGEDGTYIKILGCNQSDAITLANFRKSTTRVLGYRWPKAIHQSRTVQAGAIGAVTSAVAVAATGTEAVNQLQQVQEPLQATGMPALIKAAAIIGTICAFITLGTALYTIYRRVADHNATGV